MLQGRRRFLARAQRTLAGAILLSGPRILLRTADGVKRAAAIEL